MPATFHLGKRNGIRSFLVAVTRVSVYDRHWSAMLFRACKAHNGANRTRIAGSRSMRERKTYSPEDVRRRIEELGKEEPWFHSIDLGNGISTMKNSLPHLQKLWDRIAANLPADLSKKSVLDIGCNAGFFSVQAKRANAARVVGIDMGDRFLKQAEFVRDVLNLDIDYRKLDVSDLHSRGMTFDVVLCLGVIYHCSNPFWTARCVASATRECAVVESAIVKHESVAEMPLWEFVFPGYRPDTLDQHERMYNWWFPNISGLKAVFRAAGFDRVETIYQLEDRATVICYK
ncbi:MAG TPA: DUF1698 domain-containing protein [Desulfomonilaceae bacterium]|nr:DUF1698 domain-containing protein [Desulfomonilaceae bacterium]